MSLIRYAGLVALLLFRLPLYAADQQSSPPQPVVESYTLEAAIQRAMTKFEGLEAARLKTQQVFYKAQEVRHSWIVPKFEVTNVTGPAPKLGPGFGPPNFPPFEVDILDLTVANRLEISIVQPIYTFGRLSNAGGAANAGLEAAREDERVELHDLVFQIKQMYFGLAAFKSLMNLIEESEKNLKKVRDRIEVLMKKKSAEVTESDRLKVKVYAAELQRRRLQVEEGMQKVRYGLALVLGYDLDATSWDIRDRSIKRYKYSAPTMQEAVLIATRSSARLKQIDHLVEVKRRLLNVAQANMYPNIFFFGFMRYTVTPGREDLSNPYLVDGYNDLDAAFGLGIRQDLSLHILSDRHRQAKMEYEQAKFKQKLAKGALEVDLRNKVVTFEKNDAKQQVSRDGLRAARSWLFAEMDIYQFGISPTKEVLDSFVAYAKARSDYIDATLNYNIASAELSRSLFKELGSVRYEGDGRGVQQHATTKTAQ